MKITYGIMLASTHALQSLVGQSLPLKQSYRLSKIVKAVNEELDFFRQKRDEILGSDSSEKEKNEKLNDLLNFEVDWTLEPVVLTLEDDISLSAADIDSSRGIIEISE